MPAAQQAALDPYMALIVGYRKSGLSLNHIIGCPLDCGYCVRHFWGNFEVKTPHLLCDDEQAVDLLTGHHAFRPRTTPIQLLNKATDPFLPGVRPHLFDVLRALDERGYTNHVLLITRFRVTAADMAALESLRHLRVTLLFTYSGITDPRIEPIARSQHHPDLDPTACAPGTRTGVVLYWRPIVPGWNDHPATMARVLDTGRDADAIVFTGYYHKPQNAAYLHGQGVALPYGDRTTTAARPCPPNSTRRSIAAWRASGIDHAAVPQDLLRRRLRPRRVPTTTATGASARSATSAPTPSSTAAPTTTASPPPAGHAPRPDQLGYHTPLPDRGRPRVDPRPRRAAALRHPAHPGLPDLGTGPAALPARPRPRPARPQPGEPEPVTGGRTRTMAMQARSVDQLTRRRARRYTGN